MPEMHRRTALSTLGLAGITAAASAGAGPLNPPAGAVTGTGRTNDEIYNKIPSAGAGDGRTPISGGSGGAYISQPGSYVLTGNITSAFNAVVIDASDVTLDLNGYTITSTATNADTLVLSSNRRDLIVRNGIIVGGLRGIVTGPVTNVLLEDLVVLRSRTVGIEVGGSTVRSVVLRRCRVFETGSPLLATDSIAGVVGINAYANTQIEECTVARLSNATTGGTITGIFANQRCLVRACCVMQDTTTTGTGIWCFFSGATGGIYRDNSVIGFSTSYGAGGINGGGNTTA